LGEALLAAALAGTCLGFLRWNFHPAKVFMGDAGSHFLGFTIAALSVLQNWKVATGIAFAVPVLILAVPIFDTAFAIFRRLPAIFCIVCGVWGKGDETVTPGWRLAVYC
jgi:UDP-GlcNAc:undecaprenyl-phosphate GlcNAc-1-phosphate transferase